MSKFLDQQGLSVLWEKVKDRDTLRNNDYNYAGNFVPANGQICFVDTARNGLQIKIGDGVTQWANLPYKMAMEATEDMPGPVKLYKTLGEGEDGSINQKKVTEEFNARYKTSVNQDDECLVFKL